MHWYTHRWRIPYGPIVLCRVVVRVAVARAGGVEGGADGRQLGGPGVRGVVGVLLVRVRVRQGDGVGRLVWLRSCAKSSWCLRRRVVSSSCLPLGPWACHHSFARVAVHGRATSTAKPQRAQERPTIGGCQQRSGGEMRRNRRGRWRTRRWTSTAAAALGMPGRPW
jgi:hypothetical protein